MTNIITACFGGTRFTNTRPAWLIDHGMVLQIKGVELPDVYEVDFSNSKAETATRVLGGADGVVIPDQYFLSKAQQIYAWVYLTTGDSGFTVLQVTIPLAQRPDVTDEPPTPQETDLIEQAIAALNDGVEAAAESAEDSEAWAVGTRSSEPVSEDDPTYENSAKYWAEQAHTGSPVTSVNGQTGDVELTLDDIQNGSTYVRTTPAQVQQIETNKDDISSIEVLIPNQASAANQLADKGFVNSSIQTSSAHFRGNWANWAAVPTNPELYPADDDGVHTPTSNDYMVIQDASDYPVPAGETALEGTWRFKYSGVWATNGRNGWQKEYQVNETPLTAAQLAALNSGATAALIAQIGTNETAIEQLQTGKQAKITVSGILKGDGSGGVSAAVAGTDYLQSAPVTSVNGQTGDVTVQVATDAQVAAAVDTWLGENVAQETGYVLDASLTMSNAAPPASAVGDLKSAFDETVIVTPSNNLLNPNNIITGKYYKTATVDGRTVVSLTENSAFSCAYIDIVPGDEYSLTGISYAAYNGDADGYAIGVANSSTTSVQNPALDTAAVRTNYNNTDKTITRLYFSWRHATYPTASYMANKGALLPYEPYGVPTRDLAPDINVSSDSITNEIYFVDINGTGHFTSLMDAFVTLKDNEKSKTIYVLSGEYDVYNEIGGDTFVNSIPSDAESYWDYVTLVPKNTKVIGVGGVVLKYLPESVPDIAAQFISPINISDGNIYMENIKIICKNCRYGIHDQTRNDFPNGYEHIYKNISVIKDDASGYTGKAQAYGGGMNKSATLIFENCAFQSNRVAWSLHNAHNGSGDVVMRNCAFNNLIATRDAHPSVRFGNVSGVQTRVGVNISGCYFNDGVRVTNESSVERPNAFDITMINCVGNTTITITNQTNIYTPQIFNA